MTDRRPIDWSPVAARLDRASHHVDDLASAVAHFASLPPYARRKTATAAGTMIERADTILPAPREFAMFVSDAIHQARAALDNAVGAMRRGGPSESSAFPIVRDPAKYEAIASSAIGGVPGWAAILIRSVQPFAPDYQAFVGSQLAQLHDMARLDRHRAPALHVAFLQPDFVEGTVIEFRGDGATWVEVEYRSGEVHRIHYEIVVRFADGPLKGWEVAGGTRMLVGMARSVIEQLQYAAARAFARPE